MLTILFLQFQLLKKPSIKNLSLFFAQTRPNIDKLSKISTCGVEGA